MTDAIDSRMAMVWVPDSDWDVPEDVELLPCRRCGNPSAAILYRKHRGQLPRPWAYCGDHLYGREIIRGVVHTHLPAHSPAARKGESMQDWNRRA